MVATNKQNRGLVPDSGLSVRFSSRQWLLPRCGEGDAGFSGGFQSPFHRGNGCYYISISALPSLLTSFSPLFIGAMVATGGAAVGAQITLTCLLSHSLSVRLIAFHRGNGCYHESEASGSKH